MGNLTNKLMELTLENKDLYSKLTAIQSLLMRIKSLNDELERDKTKLTRSLECHVKEINMLKKKINLKERIANDREKVLKNEINRKDVFKNKLLGSKKDEQLCALKEEFNTMSKRNTILMRMLYELVRIIGSDFDVFYSLLEITENEDCPILEDYLESLRSFKNTQD